MKRIILATLVAVLFALLPFAARAAEKGTTTTKTAVVKKYTQEQFLHALRLVESRDNPKVKDGDGGKAIGVYQIWRAYFNDAIASDESIRSLKYEDCRDPDKAAMVVGAYLRRYAPKSWEKQNWKVLARVHNGGPAGHRMKATLKYWAKVEAAMKSLD